MLILCDDKALNIVCCCVDDKGTYFLCLYAVMTGDRGDLLCVLLCDDRGTYFMCDRLVIDDVLHNVQAEWYALS